jgi:hypothetical protein
MNNPFSCPDSTSPHTGFAAGYLFLLKGEYDALTPTYRNLARPIAALCATLILPVLYGCQGHRIVARLNGEAVNDDQYLDRLERVVPQEFEQLAQANTTNMPLDAGAIAMVTTLREKALEIVAKNKNAVPTSEAVDQIYHYDLLLDPSIDAALKMNTLTPDDIKKNIRIAIEAVGIGTDGAKVDPKELDDAFKAAKTSPLPADKLDIPERYGLKLLGVKNLDDGQVVLGRLKATGDFKTEAQQEGVKAPFDGSEHVFAATQIQAQLPVLYDALKTLKPGQFAPAPLTLSGSGPNGQQTFYAVVQKTKEIPAHEVTLPEVSAELTQRVLKKKFPQWQQHFVQSLNDFLRDKNTIIEVDIDRYKALVPAFLKTAPEATSSQSGMTGAQGGVPMSSGAGMPSGSAPTGSGPTGSTPATSTGGKP